jgi:PadR family transcriptional regulator, regulatory protein PadR
MSGPMRVTRPLLDVLEVLLDALGQDQELHGWAIMKAAGRSGPTVYGVIDRLEDAGWVVARWEDQNPEPSRPRRRFYRLTPSGAVAAREVVSTRQLKRQSSSLPRPGLAPVKLFLSRRVVRRTE